MVLELNVTIWQCSFHPVCLPPTVMQWNNNIQQKPVIKYKCVILESRWMAPQMSLCRGNWNKQAIWTTRMTAWTMSWHVSVKKLTDKCLQLLIILQLVLKYIPTWFHILRYVHSLYSWKYVQIKCVKEQYVIPTCTGSMQ